MRNLRKMQIAWACCSIISTLVIGIAACTSAKEKTTTETPDAALNKNEQQALEEYRAELEIGRNMAGRLLQFYGTQKDEDLLNYVNQVGAYVGKSSDHPERRYMFEIVNTDIVNAFACPGGYIIVTMGAIRHAVNEAELASILAHEVAHVGHKHMFDKLRSMSKDELEKADALAKKRMELPKTVLARERPKAENNAMGEVVAKYLSGGAAGLNIVKAAGAGMAVMLEQGLGAEKEYEADGLGVRFAMNAGYEPRALDQYLCRLKKKDSTGTCVLPNEKKAKAKEAKTILEKTHPAVEDRIANIDKVLKELQADGIPGATGKKRFAKYKNKLPAPKNG